MTDKKMTISYIFPVYNNAESLELLYDTMKNVMKMNFPKYTYEFMFVNDGSRDNSLDILLRIAKKDKRVKVLNLSRNFGHQAAVTAGLTKVMGDATIIMDADLQDPPRVCVELIRKWEKGFDVVYAQRKTRKDGKLKRLTADLYYRILTSVSTVNIPRNTGDFRLVSKQVVTVVNQMKEYDRFLRGMFSFIGFKQAAVQFNRDKRYGNEKSQYTIKKMVMLAKAGIFGFSELPLRFVSRLGYTVSILSIIGIFYALVIKLFFTQIAVPGWAMTVVAIFFMGGVQLVMLGVIGEYIARIYNEVRHRPTFIIQNEVNTDR